MPTRLWLVVALLAAAACKREPKPAANAGSAPAAEPAAQNAVTQHADRLKAGVDRAQDVQGKANAALQQNAQAIQDAGSEP